MANSIHTPTPVAAITFDFWNTIAREAAPALESIRATMLTATLREAGLTLPNSDGLAILREEWSISRLAWRAGRIYTSLNAAEHICADMGLQNDELVQRLARDLGYMYEASRFELCPGIRDALSSLCELGLRVGVISDTGFTPAFIMRRRMGELGILKYFVGQSFSDEVGAYKPERQIFEHALSYLRCPPYMVLHVGDLYRNDVLGARNAGFQALRYVGVFDDPTASDQCDLLRAHAELTSLVQVA